MSCLVSRAVTAVRSVPITWTRETRQIWPAARLQPTQLAMTAYLSNA